MSRLCSTPIPVVPASICFSSYRQPTPETLFQPLRLLLCIFLQSVRAWFLHAPFISSLLNPTPLHPTILPWLLVYIASSLSILSLPPGLSLASSILPHCPIFSFILTGFPLFMLSPQFQPQDLRSGTDFEGTHIFAGPAHGRQGWVVITEFKLAALEVFPLKQCHAAVTVVLRHRNGWGRFVDRSGPPKWCSRIHS